MSYLKSLQPIQQSLILDNEIIYELVFSLKVITSDLIKAAYSQYVSDNTITFKIDEETITVGIYGKLENIIKEQNYYNIVLSLEARQNTIEISKGEVLPKTAKRFDLVFTHVNEHAKKQFQFGVEAKIICENKVGSRDPNFLQNEYVNDKGMGKFINGIYKEEGFMLGYYLNVAENSIIEKLNTKIKPTHSIKHTIQPVKNCNISFYSLNHKTIELHHIFLDFSKIVWS